MLLLNMDFDLSPTGQFEVLKNVDAASLISAFVLIVLLVSSILFFFNLLFGGIKWILSGGRKEKVDEAKSQIVNALIGLVIVFSAFAIVNLLSTFFGVDLFVFNIPNIQPY